MTGVEFGRVIDKIQVNLGIDGTSCSNFHRTITLKAVVSEIQFKTMLTPQKGLLLLFNSNMVFH